MASADDRAKIEDALDRMEGKLAILIEGLEGLKKMKTTSLFTAYVNVRASNEAEAAAAIEVGKTAQSAPRCAAGHTAC